MRWWWSCFSCPREGDQQAAEVDMQHRADGPASKKVRVVASSDRAPVFVCGRCAFTTSPPVALHRSDSAQFEVNPPNRPRHLKLHFHCTRGRCLRRGSMPAGFRRGSPRPALLGVPSVSFDTTSPVIKVCLCNVGTISGAARLRDCGLSFLPPLRSSFSFTARAPLCVVPFGTALRTSTRARAKRQATAARRT